MASRSSAQSPSYDLLKRSLYLPFGVLAVYLTFFFALLTPFFQRHFIFLHAISFPFFPTYDQPERYGLAPFKASAFALSTSDGEKIGAWHVLPEIFYQQQLASTHKEEGVQHKWGQEVYKKAMQEYPTVLYLHGNSMNRAAPWRIEAYRGLTSRIHVNVVAIDYRGFGDSTGTPSERGLVEDAYSAVCWIRAQQASSKQSITLFGQSLGTGIAALLAARLESESTPADAVVLMAAYTNLKSLVKDFRLGGLLPLLKPISAIPFNSVILDKYLETQLNTIDTLPTLSSTDIVLLHAHDDPVIPLHHSHKLFQTLLTHHSSPSTPSPPQVSNRSIDDYASVHKFTNPHSQAQISFIQTHTGGHNQLTEGALDLVRLALRLPSHVSP